MRSTEHSHPAVPDLFEATRRARLLWPTLITLAGLAVLVGLGTWQLQRRAWKLDLLAKIETRATATPVPLTRALAIWRESGDIEYRRVAASGRFRHRTETYVFTAGPAGPGYHVYTPLETGGGRLLLVNRGFVPAELRGPQTRPAGQIEGETEVVGLARRPSSKPWFAPAGDQQQGVFYWPDYGSMLAAPARLTAGLESVPFFLEAEALPANPGGWPRGGVTNLSIPNRHLEYALTWFGLAATLAGVYAAFVLARLRELPPPGTSVP